MTFVHLREGLASFTRTITIATYMTSILILNAANARADTNKVFDPCSDAKVQKSDGFTFGLAFSLKDSFFFDQTQLSPCDSRLSLSSKLGQLAVYRPKVDEMSLLSINSTDFDPVKNGGYMVAFAGRKYAARSIPIFVADATHTITKFTLVLEFKEGTLQNLHWKKFGCSSCPKEFSTCLANQDCAVQTSKCKNNGGPADCSLSIQLTFSGTDKNLEVLNSWYELEKLQQNALSRLFSDLPAAIAGQSN